MANNNLVTFHTPKEIAEILRLNLLTIYEFIKDGSLTTVKLGRAYRIRSDDLDKFIDDHLTKKKL